METKHRTREADSQIMLWKIELRGNLHTQKRRNKLNDRKCYLCLLKRRWFWNENRNKFIFDGTRKIEVSTSLLIHPSVITQWDNTKRLSCQYKKFMRCDSPRYFLKHIIITTSKTISQCWVWARWIILSSPEYHVKPDIVNRFEYQSMRCNINVLLKDALSCCSAVKSSTYIPATCKTSFYSTCTDDSNVFIDQCKVNLWLLLKLLHELHGFSYTWSTLLTCQSFYLCIIMLGFNGQINFSWKPTALN